MPWKKLKQNEKVLITGANSYIGMFFEKHLAQWPEQYQVDTVDMIDGTWREKFFSGYDAVFHVAGVAHSNNGKSSLERAKLYYAAQLLKDDCPDVRWHIVGRGSDLERVQKTAKDKHLDNVIFHSRHPLEEMPDSSSQADAMLVTLQADPVISRILPEKAQSYIAVGKLIIGAINGETAHITQEAQCGFCGAADDVEVLAENVHKFRARPNDPQLGKKYQRMLQEAFYKTILYRYARTRAVGILQ